MKIFFLAQKKVAFEKAKEAYQKIIEGETKATLDQLQKLENQRKKILHQLKNARERVVKITENDPEDFFTVASLPQQTKDELMTLAQGSCLVTKNLLTLKTFLNSKNSIFALISDFY